MILYLLSVIIYSSHYIFGQLAGSKLFRYNFFYKTTGKKHLYSLSIRDISILSTSILIFYTHHFYNTNQFYFICKRKVHIYEHTSGNNHCIS